MIQVANGKQSGWQGVYIGRKMARSTIPQHQSGSPLGNPYKPAKHNADEHTRVVNLYRQWLWQQINGTLPQSHAVRAELQRLKKQAMNSGLTLDCWCFPLPCHGDVIKACLEWSIATSFDFV